MFIKKFGRVESDAFLVTISVARQWDEHFRGASFYSELRWKHLRYLYHSILHPTTSEDPNRRLGISK